MTDRMLESSFSRIRFVSWFRARTDRMLESSFSRVRFVSWFRATTDRMLESSFSRVRFVYLVQGNDWSSVGKLIFKSSIRFLGSRATTDRMLESSFSRVRFIYLVQGNDWSSVGKLIFKSSIRFLGSGQRLIECWKAHFQEFDSFSSVVALEPRKRIELLKMSFPTLDQSLPWTKKTNRTLENELSNIRSVVALNQENESNSWKWVFQHSMVQGNDWSNVGKLISRVSIRFLGSGQRLIECWKAHFQEFDSFSWFRAKLIECWKAHFQEFDSFSWFRARTDRMLESSFSRVRFVFLVQGKDRRKVGKLVFRVRSFSCSGQRLIECWKARFQEFDSFTWFRAMTDRMLERSFSRVRFVYLVQGNDWSNVGKLVFKSSISLLSVVALNQVNESNSWKRPFQHSISHCPEPSKRIELLKTSFPTFDQSLPWTE